MAFFVTYDVRQNHTLFKDNLRRAGFYDCINMTLGPRKRLPNTAVIHDDVNQGNVAAAFMQALVNTIPNPGLEKVAYIEFSGRLTLESNSDC